MNHIIDNMIDSQGEGLQCIVLDIHLVLCKIVCNNVCIAEPHICLLLRAIPFEMLYLREIHKKTFLNYGI